MIIQKDLENIIRKFSNEQIAIFCGAGISYNSGLPLANQLTKYILSKIGLLGKESAFVLNSNLPFEAFMETILNETHIDEILEIFEQGLPNTNHKLIAELAKQGIVQNIVTTNFDQLIEKAFEEAGLFSTNKVEIFSTEASFREIDWNSNTIKLIKIHGCASNKVEIGISMESVANQTNSIFKRKIVKDFFSNKINSYVLFLGYSCSDSFDICPEIESLRSGYSKILFIDHTILPKEKIENIGLKKDKNPFRHFMSGDRIIINTDHFVKSCWEELNKTIPVEVSKHTVLWEVLIDKWFDRASDENSLGFKHHISSRLFYNIGKFELAIREHKKGILVAEQLNDLQPLSSELANLGMTLNTLGRYSEAREYLEKALVIAKQVNIPQLEISQTENLGNVYRNLKDFDGAIRLFKKAIELSEKYNEKRSLGTSLGNLALVYNHTGQFSHAISCVNRGLQISYDLGNKQAEASLLSSLGVAYFSVGQIAEGITCLSESHLITQLIGDKKNECLVLINLANAQMNSNSCAEAILNARASLKLAHELGLQEAIIKAKLILTLCER